VFRAAFVIDLTPLDFAGADGFTRWGGMMGKVNSRLEAARGAYRAALESARANPTPETWARLRAAGKELSAATEPRAKAGGRKARREVAEIPTLENPREIEALD
jgi:hypothetical protein